MSEETLFELALNAPDAERAALLDRECAGNPTLRTRVEALLAAHFASGSPLDPPADGTRTFDRPPDTTAAHRPAEAEGTVVAGRYKLLQQIGEGGMGTVWMADQTEPVKRRVAVKLIRTERGQSKTILSRFEAERQAIALMDHPHIARLLDAGTTDTGSPFFVMELVKGVPLNEYCDAHRLSVPDRLHLFMQICSAVQHAHQKGVIHRDLKPSNILVESHDGKPVPKVIDFGLAKATTGLQLTEHTLFTGFGSVMGTPLYMAPEQASFNAVDVDTRADVYALGVILYELLTGTTPLTRDAIKKAALDEMLKLVREQEAPTPSSRLSTSDSKPSVAANRQTEPAKLGRFVKGELDWIVLKALSKDRDRRYETANGFAKDVERFLAHEPVQAGPPSVSYKFRKFVRRNRGQVIAASLMLFALVAGVIGTTLGLLEARRQAELARDEAAAKELARAEEAAQRKRAVEFRDMALNALRATTDTDVELLIGGRPELGANEKAYLEAIAKRWQAFANQEGTDEQARAIRGEGHHRVSGIWYRLGRREEVRWECEQALVIREKLVADFPTVPDYRSDLGRSHNNLGLGLAALGKQAEAEKHYRQALAILEKVAADFPTVPDYRRHLATTHSNLGGLLHGKGDLVEAEKQHRQALAIREKLVADFPAVPDYRRDLATTHNNLGGLLVRKGDLAEAEKQHRQALAIREKLAADFPTVPDYRSDLGRSHNNLGLGLAALGKQAEAEKHYRQALAILEKLVADFPTVPDYRSESARSHDTLGRVVAERGRHAEAEAQFNKAVLLQEKLAADFPDVPDYRSGLARSRNDLGRVVAERGRYAEAEEQFNKAVLLQEKLAADFPDVPDYRSGLAASHMNLGSVLDDLKRRAGVEEQYIKSLAIREKLVADFPDVPGYRISLGGCFSNYGVVVRDRGHAKESLGWFDKAVATLTPVHLAEPRDVTAKQGLRNSHSNRAVAYDQLQRSADAVKDWGRAIELSPPAEQPGLRACRATSLQQAGMVAEAVTEVAELTKSPNWFALQWYDFACVYAVASGKFADKKQAYADRAMELLAAAVKAGWNDAAHIKQDTDLDAIRERDDFKKLVAALQPKAVAPPPRAKP